MAAHSLIGLLAEPTRLRVFAAVVLGADTVATVADQAGTSLRDATRALRRLQSGGVVTLDGAQVVLHADVFSQAAREGAEHRPAEDFGVSDPEMVVVLRSFIREGRLQEIPRSATKRLMVLEYLAASFEPGQDYPEPEVNEILHRWHPDHATLRRYLVDAGFLTRAHGIYRRCGGRIHPLEP